MMKSICVTAIILIFVVSGLTACKKVAPTDSPLTSLLNSPISAPGDAAPSQITGPNFSLDPIIPGATEATGRGPVGLSIVIADMTTMGTSLGSGMIDQDGKFTISLDRPAVENHVIGIRVVADREFTPQDLDKLMQKQGPGFKNYPRVGEAFDTVVVRNP